MVVAAGGMRLLGLKLVVLARLIRVMRAEAHQVRSLSMALVAVAVVLVQLVQMVELILRLVSARAATALRLQFHRHRSVIRVAAAALLIHLSCLVAERAAVVQEK
ncbi:MAG: hypothetical protein EBT00_17350 [Proteobacteria bacterium]|nr:hypothetical protein [Pseudomonadota bacterium]